MRNRHSLVLSAAAVTTAFALSRATPAAAATWNPPPDGDNDWFNKDNWDTGAVPGNLTPAVVLDRTPTIDGNAVCGFLTLGATNLILDANPGGQPNTLRATTGAAISGSIYVAGGQFYSGLGNTNSDLTITNYMEVTTGGYVESLQARVGANHPDGGFAKVSVRGAGTVWDSTFVYGAPDTHAVHGLFVTGITGPGELEILTGATVISESARVGGGGGFQDKVTVSGSSLWDVSRSSGGTGFGTLTVSGGDPTLDVNLNSRLTCVNANVGYDQGATGTINVAGDGSTFNAGSPTAGTLMVGYRGAGTVNITGGADATGYAAALGDQSGGAGHVTVSGQGSTWTLTDNSSSFVGRFGAGTLEVNNGAHVTFDSVTVGGNSFLNGTSVGGTGTVTVSGTGSRLETGFRFRVGTDGTGTVLVKDGGALVTTGLTYLGSVANSSFSPLGNASVTITGTGSSLTSTTDLNVNNGSTLLVTAGATANTRAIVGGGSATPDRRSYITASGPGTVWTNTGVSLGGSGPATLSVYDGATMTSAGAYSVGAGGTISVYGTGSSLAAGNVSVSGSFGVSQGASAAVNGSLTVGAGGAAGIHDAPSSLAVNDVNLNGSTASPARFNLYDGSVSTLSDLRLANGAGLAGTLTQTAGTLTVGSPAFPTIGVLLFGAGTSTYALEGGTLNARNKSTAASGNGIQANAAATYTFDLAGGTIRATGNLTASVNATLRAGTTTTFDSNGFTFTWAGNLSGTGQLRKTGSGALNLTAASVQSIGGLTVDAGTVNFSGAGSSVTIPFLQGAGGLSLSNSSLITTNQSDGLANLASLSLNNATLDLSDGTITIATAGTPTNTVVNYLKAAYNKGRWNLKGLTSSTTQTLPGTSLGYATDGARTTVKFTWSGDLNLDGVVNAADLALIAPGGTTWSQGDLNFDQKVTPDDYALLALGASLSAGANISTLIPEPIAAAALCLAIPLLLRRRRCRR